MSDKATWYQIDEATVSADVMADIERMRELNKQAAFHRDRASEKLAAALAEVVDVPEGMEVAIGYNFGRIAFAVIPKRATTSKSKTEKVKLSMAKTPKRPTAPAKGLSFKTK